jgi:AcrR family transcriptional regulator
MSSTRALLLRTALELLAQNPRRLPMARLAREAGVAKATVYNHFRTSGELLTELCGAAALAWLLATLLAPPSPRAVSDGVRLWIATTGRRLRALYRGGRYGAPLPLLVPGLAS